jgi:general secretion pathway protein E
LDLGIPSFLIKATVVGILAQRLAKKICTNCKEVFEIDAAELASLGLDLGKDGVLTLHRGKGCQQCRGTGYRGRIGIYEVLPITDTINALITSETDANEVRKVAKAEGMATLRENAIHNMLEGVTTYQEVLRVTWGQV